MNSLPQKQISIALIAILLMLGFIFRVVNLDRKVFWVDEVATALRVAGHTRPEVTQLLAGGTHSPAALLAYQRLDPQTPLSHTLAALRRSPEHAPLYFLLTRLWMQVWGSSATAIRSFSVVCSLLLLVGIYGLSRELFSLGDISLGDASSSYFAWIPWITVVSAAISPVFIAYAQEARPYSLWLFTLVLSGLTLLRALRLNRLGDWLLYGLALTAGLYTSWLSVGIALGQGLYVGAVAGFRPTRTHPPQRLRRWGMAILGVVVALLPWLWLIGQQGQDFQDNTTWMRLPMPNFARLIIWFYSLAILYFDVPVVLTPVWIAATEVTVATAVVAILLYALYSLFKQSRISSRTSVEIPLRTRIKTLPQTGLFVLSLSLPIPLILILLDLVSQGRYSTAPRYLLPFHLGSHLAIAALLARQLTEDKDRFQQRKWQGIAGFLVAVSLLSNLIHLETSPRYLKSRNLHNSSIAKIIHQAPNSCLVSESQNTMDLLSLSHLLTQATSIKILSDHSSAHSPLLLNEACETVFLFNPSAPLKQTLQKTEGVQLEERYRPQVLIPSELALSLWQLR